MNESTAPAVHVIDHPIVRSRLSLLRQESTDSLHFRQALHDIAKLMVYQMTSDLETEVIAIETPLCPTEGHRLKRPLTLVPILRAGVGLMNGIAEILSEAAVGYIGLYRDEETLEPQCYYSKFPPNLAESDVILVDPMLATGNSSAEGASQLKAAGATRIKFAALIAAPEGIETFHRQHPDIPIYTAHIDEGLNENAYIVPGLGDAGDRYFGTV
ncbi:MAG: uracil phosphoribosyltransferase [Verrucomicrobiae bacterium]|nr:uracil phosphoribosyltransferase [Verrucomicrobiae bacterium]